MKFNILIMLLVGVWTLSMGQTPANKKEPDHLPLDHKVRYGKLDNGFTYYLRNTDIPESIIRFHLVVKAGYDHEDDDQLEYAHLLEHLGAKETRHFSDLRNYFLQGGRHIDARTEGTNTKYFGSIPANDKQVINDGLRVLRDWAQGNKWEPESIAVERAAIEGEMRNTDPYRKWKSNSTEYKILENIGYKAYDKNKALLSIQNFNSEAFLRYYEEWYRPDLQAAIIVGDFDIDSVEIKIRHLFADLKVINNPKDAQERIAGQTIKLDDRVHFTTITDSIQPDLKLEIFRYRPNFEFSPETEVDYRNFLLQQLYMIILEGKGKQMVQQYNPPFLSFWANYKNNFMAGKQLNVSQMSIELPGNDIRNHKFLFQNALKAWKQMHKGFSQKDLDLAKEELYRKYSNEQFKTSNEYAQRYHEHFIQTKSAPHPDVETKLISKILNEIDVKDLRSFVTDYGSLSKNTHYFFFKGDEIILPSYEVFKSWIKEVETMKIEPLDGIEKPIETLADVARIPLSSHSQEAEIKENIIGITNVQLPNGIKLVLKPTVAQSSHFTNKLFIRAFRQNKIPLNNRKNYLAAKVAPEVILFSGAGQYTKFELDRFLQEKEIKLRFQINKDYQSISGESSFENLPELLNLLYLYTEQPRKDQIAFEAWKLHQEKKFKGMEIRGSAEFIMDKITPILYPQVPVMKWEDIRELHQEEVFEAANKWFSDIQNYTFIVTGDFDKEKLLPILINTLSVFTNPEKLFPTRGIALNFPLQKMEKNLQFKNIDQVYAKLFFPIKTSIDLKTQIELKLLSKALHQRIWDRLREGCYAPTAGGEWMDLKNGIFAFRIDFDSALGNEDRMLSFALEEFRNLRNYGVDKDWLKTAISEELRNFESRFTNPGYFNFWQEFLQQKLENGEDPVEGILMYGTILEHFINLEDINSAAKNLMREDNFQQFLGFPEDYL